MKTIWSTKTIWSMHQGSPQRRPSRWLSRQRDVVYGLLAGSGGLWLAWLLATGRERLTAATAAVLLLMGLAHLHPRTAVTGMLLLLILLGDLRRLLIPFAGWSGQDPLLLVVPAVAGLLVISLLVSSQLRLDTPLARGVLLLMGVMGLQMFNPAQGGLIVGIAGAMFYLVPLLWFWIGQAYADAGWLTWLLTRLLIPLGVLAALLGLYQVFVGFLPFQQAWIDTAGYAALWVSADTIRPFAFFTSGQEYAAFLTWVLVTLWACLLRRQAWHLGLLLPVLLVALFLIGSRGPIVKVAFTFALLWAAGAATWRMAAVRLALALLLGAAGLFWSLTQVQHMAATGGAQDLIAHQTNGLLNPTDEEHSTASVHTTMMFNGFMSALHRPLGLGLGATTKAAGKFGGHGASSEVDLTDVILACGLPGGVIYLFILIMVFRTAVQYWRRTGALTGLIILGVLVAGAGVWLRGGMYALVALTWLCIGALDRLSREP